MPSFFTRRTANSELRTHCMHEPNTRTTHRGGSKQQEYTQTMSLGQVESLPLDYNQCVVACLDVLLKTKRQASQAKLLKVFQNVPIVYAGLAVKRNAGIVSEAEKVAKVVEGYREIAVPGFLAWAAENGVALPAWLTTDMFWKSTLTGAPILNTNGDRLWKRFSQALREMKRDFNPIWDSFVRGQPGGKLPSGHVSRDAIENLLNGLCVTTSGSSESPINMEDKENSGARTNEGEGSPHGAATDGGKGEGAPGGKEQEKEHGGNGAAEQEQEQGDEEAAWGDGGGGNHEPASEDQGGGGDGETDPSVDSVRKGESMHPARPPGWIHQYMLIYCLIGRPSRSEDPDLATARKKSGPANRPAKRKVSLSSETETDEVLSPGEGSGGILTSSAIRMFAGAGEAQSRAKVKKENDMVAQRNAQASSANKIALAVESLTEIVKRRETLDQEAAKRAREAAARARKDATIADYKGELEYLHPGSARYAEVRALLVTTFAKPVSHFYDDSASDSAPATPGAPAAATPASSGLPGFSGASREVVFVGGGGAGGGSELGPDCGGTHQRSI